MIIRMSEPQKSLLIANASLNEELIPCDGSAFSLPYQQRLMELLEEIGKIDLASDMDIHPRSGYEKKECAEARACFKKEDWILAAVILRGERMVYGLLVYRKDPKIAYLYDCMSLQVKSAYFDGLDIDEGSGERIDIAFFVETLTEVEEEQKPEPKKKAPIQRQHTVILGEDDEDYEAPEVVIDSFVPSKKKTFHNQNTHPEQAEIVEDDEEVSIIVDKPSFSANRKGKPRKI